MYKLILHYAKFRLCGSGCVEPSARVYSQNVVSGSLQATLRQLKTFLFSEASNIVLTLLCAHGPLCNIFIMYSYTRYTTLLGLLDIGLLGGVTVRASDLRSSGRGLGSQPGRYRAT